jgi:hypothetical protein
MLVVTPVSLDCQVVFITAIFLQISITPMTLMTGRLILIRHATLSANSNSQILVPLNGMCFTYFCCRTSMASGNALPPPLRGAPLFP